MHHASPPNCEGKASNKTVNPSRSHRGTGERGVKAPRGARQKGGRRTGEHDGPGHVLQPDLHSGTPTERVLHLVKGDREGVPLRVHLVTADIDVANTLSAGFHADRRVPYYRLGARPHP